MSLRQHRVSMYSEKTSKAKTLNDTKFSMGTEEVNQQMWLEKDSQRYRWKTRDWCRYIVKKKSNEQIIMLKKKSLEGVSILFLKMFCHDFC